MQKTAFHPNFRICSITSTWLKGNTKRILFNLLDATEQIDFLFRIIDTLQQKKNENEFLDDAARLKVKQQKILKLQFLKSWNFFRSFWAKKKFESKNYESMCGKWQQKKGCF